MINEVAGTLKRIGSFRFSLNYDPRHQELDGRPIGRSPEFIRGVGTSIKERESRLAWRVCAPD